MTMTTSLPVIEPGTFAYALRQFAGSTNFELKAHATQIKWLRSYGHVERTPLSKMPVRKLHPRMVQVFLDEFADRPALQKDIRSALKVAESWLLIRGKGVEYSFMTGTQANGKTGHY